MFAWWGQFVYRHRWAVLGVSAVMLAGSIVALFNGGTLKNSGGRNTESGRALALMQDQLPQNGAGWGIFSRIRHLHAPPNERARLHAALAPLAAAETQADQQGHNQRVTTHCQSAANKAKFEYFDEQKAQAYPQNHAGQHADV